MGDPLVVSGIVMSDILRDEQIESVLEFGSHTGETYKRLQPPRYLGIDVAPLWRGNGNGCEIRECDVRNFEGNGERFDLVICDAHHSEDNPELSQVTRVQCALANKLGRFVAVDDCWIPAIGDTAFEVLGVPSEIVKARPWLWIWKR